MDEAIPLDHPRPHPLDVIQYARSSYYYDNVYIFVQFDPKTHSSDFIDQENKIIGPSTSCSSYNMCISVIIQCAGLLYDDTHW